MSPPGGAQAEPGSGWAEHPPRRSGPAGQTGSDRDDADRDGFDREEFEREEFEREDFDREGFGPDESPSGGSERVGSARQEAERLVVAALATMSVAANRVGYHVEEGCRCPVCRAILMLRDPDPEIAERLASGAGDIAEGLAGLLRAWREPKVPGQRMP